MVQPVYNKSFNSRLIFFAIPVTSQKINDRLYYFSQPQFEKNSRPSLFLKKTPYNTVDTKWMSNLATRITHGRIRMQKPENGI